MLERFEEFIKGMIR